MAEVFAIRYIKLRPKIKIEEFETFLDRTVATLPSFWVISLLKWTSMALRLVNWCFLRITR